MKRVFHKKDVGKIVIGLLIGSLIGTLVGRLTATSSGRGLGRKLTGKTGKSGRASLKEKLKTGEGNIESKARKLASAVNEHANPVKKVAARRKKVVSPQP